MAGGGRRCAGSCPVRRVFRTARSGRGLVVRLGVCVAVVVVSMGGDAVGQGSFGDDAKEGRAGKKETKELAKRLILGEEEDREVMGRIVDRMKDVEAQLLRRYDAGAETQRIQREILKELESAIASAVRRGRGGGGSGAAGDVRRRTRGRGAERVAGRAGGEPGATGESRGGEANEKGGAVRGEKRLERGGRLRALRRGWGHLPARDREEVIQGASEKSLDRYRAWIERYYRALVEGAEQ